MESTININVVKEDIDELGHVNNSKYVTYLERGRKKWYGAVGLTDEELRKENIGTVIVRIDILYRKEATLGDSLNVLTIPMSLGNKSYVFKQTIYNQFEELISEATVTSVMFDTLKRKSIVVVDKISRHFHEKS